MNLQNLQHKIDKERFNIVKSEVFLYTNMLAIKMSEGTGLSTKFCRGLIERRLVSDGKKISAPVAEIKGGETASTPLAKEM